MAPRIAELTKPRQIEPIHNLYPRASSTHPQITKGRPIYSGSPQLLPRPDPSTVEKLDVVKKEKVESKPCAIPLPEWVKKEKAIVLKSSNRPGARSRTTIKKEFSWQKSTTTEENIFNNSV